MKRFIAVTALILVTSPVFAATPAIDEAIKTFTAVEGDKAKLDTYCKMINVGGEGELTDAQEKEVDGMTKTLGLEKAFAAGNELDPESADSEAYFAALDKLEAKCK